MTDESRGSADGEPAVVQAEPNRTASAGVAPEETEDSAEDAFERFLRERYSRLIGTVMVIVHDRALAEDIVQETFARAYLSWGKLWPDGNPPGWTHRVATNLAISWRRRAARELRAVARLGRAERLDVQPPDPFPELAPAIRSLPPRQRAAVALHYVAGLSIDEAATAMRCRPGTVKSLLHDARRQLRSKLAGDDK